MIIKSMIIRSDYENEYENEYENVWFENQKYDFKIKSVFD